MSGMQQDGPCRVGLERWRDSRISMSGKPSLNEPLLQIGTVTRPRSKNSRNMFFITEVE